MKGPWMFVIFALLLVGGAAAAYVFLPRRIAPAEGPDDVTMRY